MRDLHSLLDGYESNYIEVYFKYGKDMQNIYNMAYSPEIKIKLKTSKGNEIKFYKEGYFDHEIFFKYAFYESGLAWARLSEMIGE